MRPVLLLFDIDGTLLMGRGVPKRVILEIIRRRFPSFNHGETLPFSGMTDPLIVENILNMNGHDGDITETLINDILREFTAALDMVMNKENPPHVLPGVVELLERCRMQANCFLGLVTGNVMDGARIKLKSCDLYDYFPVGAFGSDHRDRNQLPPLAITRARRYYDVDFDPHNVWIIGDSVHDVSCAKSNNLNCLAVSSGFTSREALAAENPDHLLNGLSDTDEIINLFGFED